MSGCADRECPLVRTESVRGYGQKRVRTSHAGQESCNSVRQETAQ